MSKACVTWLTGLPGSGKSTIGALLAEELRNRGKEVELLDGDEVRKNLSPDLGFSKEDRRVHAGRVTYISKLLKSHGVFAIVCLISPYREFRERAREMIGDFVEVYVKCSLETCVKRDVKGHYKKAFAGEIENFTGVSDPYEAPLDPEVTTDTESESPEESVRKILQKLIELSFLSA